MSQSLGSASCANRKIISKYVFSDKELVISSLIAPFGLNNENNSNYIDSDVLIVYGIMKINEQMKSKKKVVPETEEEREEV